MPQRPQIGLRDGARSSQRGCRLTVHLPRTCRRPAWCDHNPAFRGSDKCASARSPKRRSLLGSGIALPALKRIDPLRSEPALHSSRARALAQVQPAVARGTGSRSAAALAPEVGLAQEQEPPEQSRPAAGRSSSRQDGLGTPLRTAARSRRSLFRWLWPPAIARRTAS